ncbi:group I intron-associated PD-(D/E)XK endonuclease [Paraconexibacter algicola]|nr:group I intron-associated PD-(D/E)XK endonuclease [Paraconexibacter algicola]
MDTRTAGDVAEAAVLHALTAAGLVVLTPFGRFGPYDLVVETAPGTFVRVQVKSGRIRNGCVEFNCCGTDHGRGVGSYAGRADVFAVHVHATGEQFVVPVAQARATRMYLRLTHPANNQVRGVRFARDHRLQDWVLRQCEQGRVDA